MPTPQEYGLDHDEWRPHQLETIQWIAEQSEPIIIQAPTGSGKTALAKAACTSLRGVSLVRTKALQAQNYADAYKFVPLYGRSNYPCVSPKAAFRATAADCLYSDMGEHHCPQYGECPYIVQRDRAKMAQAATLNYSYWMHTHSLWPAPDMLILDEAHQLPDITLDWAGITIDEKERIEWGFPMFPIIRSSSSRAVFGEQSSAEERALKWLVEVRTVARRVYAAAQDGAEHNEKERKAARRIELLGRKISATIDAIETCQNSWYILSGPNAVNRDGKPERGFVARPLTARYHFGKYFMDGSWRMMAMSATIGDPAVFAEELGISEYAFMAIPSVWPADRRPVHALDIPRLGRKAPDSAWDKQAEEIAKAILGVPKEWHGIIHTTSIAESSRLAQRLARRGLQDRVWVPKHSPTNQMIAQWEQRKRAVPGSVMVSWAFWEGYDGVEEKINIAAKVPYPYLGDEYEIQRRNFNGKFFLQRTAWQLEQGLGRTRRGNNEDYDTPTEKKGLVAIADGSWVQVRKYLSPHFMESVVT